MENENKYLSGRDIIMISLKPWDNETGSCCKQYARVLNSQGNRILFVNRVLDRMSAIRSRKDPKIRRRLDSLHGRRASLEEVAPDLWVFDPPVVLESINKIPFAGVYDLLNRVNNRRLANAINKATTQLGFKNTVLFIENEFLRAFYLDRMLNDVDKTIYYIRDYLPSQAYFKRHGQRLEPQLMKRMDVIIANSSYLMKYAGKSNPQSYFVGQGCDLRIFSGDGYALPADMKDIPRPIIGYTGAILTTRLDIGLIRTIAHTRKDWSIVMVGPEDDKFRESDLHGLPNVYFLGRKRPDELPGYVYHFDVCMNPQAVNEMTVGNYPLKIDEYLAMGKPVVATRTEAMEMFSEFVLLGDTAEDYVANIQAVLSAGEDPGRVKARKEFAGGHTWESCVQRLNEAFAKAGQN